MLYSFWETFEKVENSESFNIEKYDEKVIK